MGHAPKVVMLEQGKKYSAHLSLGMLERLAGNDVIAGKLREVGFTEVVVEGTGATRNATGIWPEPGREVTLPEQVVGFTPA